VHTLEDVVPHVIDATREIFTGMIMMDVSQAGDPMDTLGSLDDSITGMVGLAGRYRGMLAVHFPRTLALAITSNFLGVEVDELNEDVEDAVGEIANMLGGNVKTFLSDEGKEIQLSIPSTISGENYTFLYQEDVNQVVIPFQAGEEIFHVELELE